MTARANNRRSRNDAQRGQSLRVQRLVSLQDAGTSHHDDNDVPVYHTHGHRQHMGTCKTHKSLDCPHLVNWKPGRNLGKTIMREWEKNYEAIPKSWRCKTCFAG